jgi:hypothetical protein
MWNDERDSDGIYVAIMVITRNRLTYQALEFPISTDDNLKIIDDDDSSLNETEVSDRMK